MTYNDTAYKRLCKKYTKKTTDLYVERVENAAAAGMLKRKPKDAVLTAAVWMSRDEQSGKLTTAPGYGIAKKPAAPTVCDAIEMTRHKTSWENPELITDITQKKCGGKVKSTHDEALCMSCGKQWRLLNDLWEEVADE